MYLVRRAVEDSYGLLKPLIFRLTREDPEIAHEAFIRFAQFANRQGLDKILFDNPANQIDPGFEISPAAGFNKNGNIPPAFLGYLGFNRNVVGTVNGEPWFGNKRPRIARFPETESIVNWMGFPGAGVEKVRQNLEKYAGQNMPMTINLMNTPGKQGLDALKDVEKTVRELRCVPFVDRWEYNPVCPNTPSASGGLDARKENQRHLGEGIKAIQEGFCPNTQQIYVKISPDSDDNDVKYTFDVLQENKVNGIVTTNTTRVHDSRYITRKFDKGGGSGRAVAQRSFDVQRKFYELIKGAGSDLKIIACGGIDSAEMIGQRLEYGASGIQVYTPFIFKGPKLIREARMMGMKRKE